MDPQQREMVALAMRFEALMLRRNPDPDAFEAWREAFYEAFDHPSDQTAGAHAAEALDSLLCTPTT